MLAFGSSSLLSPLSMSVYESEVIPAKKITKGSQTAESEEEGRKGGQKGTKGNLFLSFFLRGERG